MPTTMNLPGSITWNGAPSPSRFSLPLEASFYSSESLDEGVDSATPIRSEDIHLVPKVIRDFIVAVRNIKLYPPGSKSIVGVIRQSKKSLDQILAHIEKPEAEASWLSYHLDRIHLHSDTGLAYTRQLNLAERDLALSLRGPALGKRTVGLSFEIRF